MSQGQAFMHAFDRIISDAPNHMAKVILGIKAIQLRRFDQQLAAATRSPPALEPANSQFFAQPHSSHQSFSGVVVDAGSAVSQHQGQCLPA